MTPIIIILAILGVAVLWLIMAYNNLIKGRIQAEEALSDIDVQMKRRFDLIPNLVETVKGYAGHEKNVLEDVTKARSVAMRAESPTEKAQADNMLSGTLKTLFAVAENYPDLKANSNFLDLQHELSDTENKIQSARRFYNGTVRDYNTHLESFPTNLIAHAFGFQHKPLFELAEGEEAARQPVKVSFGEQQTK